MLISIITISYNSKKTIERTIKSVLAQSYTDFEYIIIDGASTDGTLEIIKKYEPLFDGRMKWVSETDHGIYNAMNKGVAKSAGDVIGIVNSDDWLEPTALESIATMIGANDYSNKVFCGSMMFHYEDGSSIYYKADEKKFKEGAPQYSLNRGLFHPAMFVPKAIYDQYGMFDESIKVSADVDFIFRCFEAGVEFVFKDVLISHMSDGGASNIIDLKVFRNDYKRFLTNRGLDGFSLCWHLYRRYFILLIKKYSPLFFLKLYRNVK